MYEADELCGRVAVIAAGRIVAEGTPAELKARVLDRTIIEIESFGALGSGLDRLRALPGVISVSTEQREQAEVILVQSSVGSELTHALLRELSRHHARQGDRPRADPRGRLRRAGPSGMTRAFLSGMRVHVVQFSRNPFDLSGVFLWPILYASIAYYLLDSKNDPKLLLSASLGAAVMLMWSLVVIGSSNALENQRWLGTLELLVAAPMPFAVVIAPICVASGLVGGYGIAATLLWGRLLYGVPISISTRSRSPWRCRPACSRSGCSGS